MGWWHNLLLLCLQGCALIALSRGKYLCHCNTNDCRLEGTTTCEAEYYCYVEYYQDVLTRGCINERTPLTCENRKSSHLPNTPVPVLYCCDKDNCNKNVIPTLPSNPDEEDAVTEKPEPEVDESPVKCTYPDSDELYRTSAEGAKIINPIYIAVPVAGVCVLLALIIFAMYLLRRRTDYYEGYHYHEHVPALTQKQCDGKRPIPTTCSSCGKVNRCTDSERSSSGSETKLFLQV